MSEDETEWPESRRTWRRDLFGLMIVFGVLYFFGLGWLPLANPDEARYAEIPREMIVGGDWVTPRLNDIPYFEKPPLVYWLVGLARYAFGPSDFVARLTPACFGLAGVFLSYATARRLFSRETGLAAAGVLGTSLLYFALARILLLDMAVAVLMSAALFGFIVGVHEPRGARRRGLFAAVYACAALATLTKGLIGFLLPGAIIFLWLLVFDQWRRLRPLYLPSGVLLFLAIAAPWHVLVAERNAGWAEFYFGREHWARFTTTTHERGAPFWFFVPVLALGLFPWTGFLGSAARAALAGGWVQRKENAVAGFFLTWAAFVFLFFSQSQSKLIPYLLPALPPLAVVIGVWLAECGQTRAANRLRGGLAMFGFGCGLLAVALVVAVFKPGIVRDAEQMIALRPFAIALAITLLVGGVVAPWIAKIRGVRPALFAMGGTMTAFFLILVLATPALQRSSTRELALVARTRAALGERIYHYWAFFHDFVYYAERPVGLVSYRDELEVEFMDPTERAARFIDDAELRRQWAGRDRVWLVVRRRDLDRPEAVFADPAFRYHLIAETRAHSLLSNQP